MAVCRQDKRAPEEGAAKEPKTTRRGSKAPQEEGGDAVENQQGREGKKVGRPVTLASIRNL